MTKMQDFAVERLTSFIERVERLDAEKRDLAADIKEVFAEARGVGFDIATMKKIIKLRAQEDATRREEALILETYMRAMSMFATTPLGSAAESAEAAASMPPTSPAPATTLTPFSTLPPLPTASTSTTTPSSTAPTSVRPSTRGFIPDSSIPPPATRAAT